MDFEFLKYLNYSTIITEIKKSRKGICVICFLICVSLGILDFLVFRKHNINLDFYTTLYLIIGAIALFIWSAKIYNNIADEVDRRKSEEKKKKEYNKKIENYCKMINNLDKSAIEFLHKFIEEKSLNILCENKNENINMLDYINVKCWNTELNIVKGLDCPNLRVSINNVFYEVLTRYFNQ